MLDSLKSLSLAVCLLMIGHSSFAQDTIDTAKTIIGEWDVVLESKSPKFSEDDFKRTKKLSKKASGNSNRAVYYFSEGGKFSLMSIRDYGNSTEEGTFTLSDDKKKMKCEVTFPNNPERNKTEKYSAKILYFDNDNMVIRSGGMTYYMRRM